MDFTARGGKVPQPSPTAGVQSSETGDRDILTPSPAIAENGRLGLNGFPTEEIIRAGPGVDLALANLAFETAGTLVAVLFPCRSIIHPATGAVEVFGRPYAACHRSNMR